MKFTVTYPLASAGCGDEFMTPQALREFCRTAEEAGFDAIGFTDHPAPTHRWMMSGGHDAFEPFAALAYVAAITENVMLIPNIVVLPYRNPFLVAKSVATLDALSDGRFVLAAGVGYLKGEFRALGVDFDSRNQAFDQAIEVMRGVWTQDDFSYDGLGFTAFGQTVNPKPKGRIPVWIGGNSRMARRRVAKYGDGWAPFAAPSVITKTARTASMNTYDDLRTKLDDLWRLVEAQDRDPSSIDVCYVAPSEGGNPASKHFNPDAYLRAINRLSALGVTWLNVPLPSTSLQQALTTLTHYSTTVISQP